MYKHYFIILKLPNIYKSLNYSENFDEEDQAMVNADHESINLKLYSRDGINVCYAYEYR